MSTFHKNYTKPWLRRIANRCPLAIGQMRHKLDGRGRVNWLNEYLHQKQKEAWDRLVSAFQILRNSGWDAGNREWYHKHLSMDSDFRTFVLK